MLCNWTNTTSISIFLSFWIQHRKCPKITYILHKVTLVLQFRLPYKWSSCFLFVTVLSFFLLPFLFGMRILPIGYISAISFVGYDRQGLSFPTSCKVGYSQFLHWLPIRTFCLYCSSICCLVNISADCFLGMVVFWSASLFFWFFLISVTIFSFLWQNDICFVGNSIFRLSLTMFKGICFLHLVTTEEICALKIPHIRFYDLNRSKCDRYYDYYHY